MIALAAAVALLLTMSGCGDKSTPQSSTTGPPATPETKPIDEAIAKRLGVAVNQAMTAADVPGAIVGIWGPMVTTFARSGWPTRPRGHP